ncbi:MAG: penicillin-binding protein 2 [Bacteroidetes bacterium CG12_big_fil_rev_8_21_14_0_65_60_17]|nr:MAG: penicillin-binding protein 2 [Bacteroidetes bacterium CG12_big_fil_rev_8_21_14_0_65_60_17]
MDETRLRLRIFSVFTALLVMVLVLRLAQLQIVDYSDHSGESRSNAVKEQRVLPARGMFFDRTGRLLVDNTPGYNLLVTPRYFDAGSTGLLASLLDVPDSLLVARVATARKWSAFRPSILYGDVPFETLSMVLEQRHRLPGISYELFQKRRYRSEANMSHVLGYVREIGEADLKAMRDKGYRPGDRIGSAGLERQYEQNVRGQVGSAFKMVNIRGQVVQDYLGGQEDAPAYSGYDVHLTLDAATQALAESLFTDKRGGLIAMDARTGGVLAFHSAPDYPLDLFTGTIDDDVWRYLTTSPEKPLFNRVTQAAFMPGSTFKPLIAIMALQEGVITPDTRFYCPGYHPRGNGRIFKCLAAHGNVNVMEAIRESCNTFFFEMMRRIDVNTLDRWGHRFGFEEKAHIDLSQREVAAGLIPDSAWYNERLGVGRWNEGVAMNLGVGQGEILVTPLQLVRYVAALANGGTLLTPYLIDHMVQPETSERLVPERPAAETLQVNPNYLRLVREGMKLVISEKATWLQIPGVSLAGKTGTAQNPRGADDSLFIGYAPADDPQIAIAVMVENGGSGSGNAGIMAMFVMEQYLKGHVDMRGRQFLWQQVLDRKSEPLARGTGAP